MTKQQKIVLYLLACVNFTHILDFMIMMPMGPMLMRSFDITPREFNFLVSSYSIMAFASNLSTQKEVPKLDANAIME